MRPSTLFIDIYQPAFLSYINLQEKSISNLCIKSIKELYENSNKFRK